MNCFGVEIISTETVRQVSVWQIGRGMVLLLGKITGVPTISLELCPGTFPLQLPSLEWGGPVYKRLVLSGLRTAKKITVGVYRLTYSLV